MTIAKLPQTAVVSFSLRCDLFCFAEWGIFPCMIKTRHLFLSDVLIWRARKRQTRRWLLHVLYTYGRFHFYFVAKLTVSILKKKRRSQTLYTGPLNILLAYWPLIEVSESILYVYIVGHRRQLITCQCVSVYSSQIFHAWSWSDRVGFLLQLLFEIFPFLRISKLRFHSLAVLFFFLFLAVYIGSQLWRGVALVFNASSSQRVPTTCGELIGTKAVSQVRSGVGCAGRYVFIKHPVRDVRNVFLFLVFCFFPELKQLWKSQNARKGGSSACRTKLIGGFLVSK